MLIDGVNSGILHPGYQVAVGVHGDLDAGVTQPFRDHLGMNVQANQKSSMGVSKITLCDLRHGRYPVGLGAFCVDVLRQAGDCSAHGIQGIGCSFRGDTNQAVGARCIFERLEDHVR